MTCIACHTQWDPSLEARDALLGTTREGGFVEYAAPPEARAPALGVLVRENRARIEPVAPGMIMTLNGPRHRSTQAPLPGGAAEVIDSGSRFLRAFALAVPHTTTRAGRSCASCHVDPYALGYGQGLLGLIADGERWRWEFRPSFAPVPFDGLPQDAWLGFLADPGSATATRRELSPLDQDSQWRTLRVGACLTCHDPSHASETAIYADFAASLGRLSPACRVPSR
jgi:hypothetical protein